MLPTPVLGKDAGSVLSVIEVHIKRVRIADEAAARGYAVYPLARKAV